MNGSLAVAATLTALQCGLSAAGMSTAAVQPGLAQQTSSDPTLTVGEHMAWSE
jgi:hypothetical protein